MKNKKLLYSVEVCSSAACWFNFKVRSLSEAKAKLLEIKKALRKLGVTLATDEDICVFKETPIGSTNRSFHVKAVCPYCSEWFWHQFPDGGNCWLECPDCDERFMLFTIEELKALGASCSKCPDQIDCLAIPGVK